MPNCNLARDQLVSAIKVQERNGKTSGYAATDTEFDAVLALYNAYDHAAGKPDDHLKGLHLDAALRAAILGAYDLTQTDRRLASIRSDIMNGVERCPVCGISAPRVLDHHLPKTSYNALAIYVRNLVPLCFDCNLSKSSSVSENAGQQFIHPYFDILPNQRFLRAEIEILNGGLVAEFGLDPAVQLPPLLASRLSYQLDRLGLNARYAREINSYLASQTTGVHMCFDALGADGVRKYLGDQALVEFAQFHANHWRPILLFALAQDDDFCTGSFKVVLPKTPSTVLAR